MIIREAIRDDIESIKELWKEFIDYHKSFDRFFSRTSEGHERFGEFVLERIKDENWLVLVAECDDRIVGHCLVTIQEHPPVFEKTRYGYIQDIAVTESYRRKSIGTTLFEKSVSWLHERGISRIELDVAATNPTSQKFWRKMNFREVIFRMSKEIYPG
jgi:ribosomal protein S18 acetylase RimI-like enzyme